MFGHDEPRSLQLLCPPGRTVKLIPAILSPLKNELKHLPPFFGMRTTRVLPPCLEAGLTDFENRTHHLNRKFVRMTHHEREPFRSLEEKMVMMVFFKMSRSISASRSFSFKSANSDS
jgi:hypothetical protein